MTRLTFLDRVSLALGLGTEVTGGLGRLERKATQLLKRGLPAIPCTGLRELNHFSRIVDQERRHSAPALLGAGEHVRPEDLDQVTGQLALRVEQFREMFVEWFVAGALNSSVRPDSRRSCLRAFCAVVWLADKGHVLRSVPIPTRGRAALVALSHARHERFTRGSRELLQRVVEGCTEEELLSLLHSRPSPWSFTPDHRKCLFGGSQYEFSSKQAVVLRILEEGYLDGDDSLHGTEIYRRAKWPRRIKYEAQELNDLFRGPHRKGRHPAWDVIVGRAQPGHFRLLLPN